MKSTRKLQAMLGLGAVALYAFGGGMSPATADTSAAGKASAFAITADILGTNVIPPTPTAETTAVAEGETDNTLIGIPGSPLIVTGTRIARSAIHDKAYLPSELNQVKQTTAGPYNARAIGQVEDVEVLINDAVPGGVLIHAGLIRAEAVAVCTADGPKYSANSEVVDLQIGGQDPLSGPLNDLLKQLTEAIVPLADLVKVDLNVVSADQSSVDAVVITLLQVIEGSAPGPLAKITLGHAEISGNPCGGDLSKTTVTECNDKVDNDGNEDIDEADPQCHTDGKADNPDSYDPSILSEGPHNDEVKGIQVPAALPKTGMAIPTGIAAGLGIGALSLLALRRRLAAV